MHLLAISAYPVSADTIGLNLPVLCALGSDCYIQSYTDLDSSIESQDYTCGHLSYDGHKGTDIALPHKEAMRAGVAVVASAPGVVLGRRDGMPDVGIAGGDVNEVSGRECGNGVVISHGGGWETQYCHLKHGTVAVRKGQQVAAGSFLGEIGLSGLTEFPHLHFSVRKDGNVVDPFAPGGKCGILGTNGLWIKAPAYRPGGLLSAGFSDEVPSYSEIKDGTAHREEFASSTPALVLWVFAFGGLQGDIVELSIEGPYGSPLVHERILITGSQAQFFRAAGRRVPLSGWEAGSYTGKAKLIRKGEELESLSVESLVERR